MPWESAHTGNEPQNDGALELPSFVPISYLCIGRYESTHHRQLFLHVDLASRERGQNVAAHDRLILVAVQDEQLAAQPARLLRRGSWWGWKQNPFFAIEDSDSNDSSNSSSGDIGPLRGVVSFELRLDDIVGFDYLNPLLEDASRVVFEVLRMNKMWFENLEQCCVYYGWMPGQSAQSGAKSPRRNTVPNTTDADSSDASTQPAARSPTQATITPRSPTSMGLSPTNSRGLSSSRLMDPGVLTRIYRPLLFTEQSTSMPILPQVKCRAPNAHENKMKAYRGSQIGGAGPRSQIDTHLNSVLLVGEQVVDKLRDAAVGPRPRKSSKDKRSKSMDEKEIQPLYRGPLVIHEQTINFRFDDPFLSYVLREVIHDPHHPRLLRLYESGLPSWAVILPQYMGGFYRRWMRILVSMLLVTMSCISMVLGFYDLYKHIPAVRGLLQTYIWAPVLERFDELLSVRLGFLLSYILPHTAVFRDFLLPLAQGAWGAIQTGCGMVIIACKSCQRVVPGFWAVFQLPTVIEPLQAPFVALRSALYSFRDSASLLLKPIMVFSNLILGPVFRGIVTVPLEGIAMLRAQAWWSWNLIRGAVSISAVANDGGVAHVSTWKVLKEQVKTVNRAFLSIYNFVLMCGVQFSKHRASIILYLYERLEVLYMYIRRLYHRALSMIWRACPPLPRWRTCIGLLMVWLFSAYLLADFEDADSAEMFVEQILKYDYWSVLDVEQPGFGLLNWGRVLPELVLHDVAKLLSERVGPLRVFATWVCSEMEFLFWAWQTIVSAIQKGYSGCELMYKSAMQFVIASWQILNNLTAIVSWGSAPNLQNRQGQVVAWLHCTANGKIPCHLRDTSAWPGTSDACACPSSSQFKGLEFQWPTVLWLEVAQVDTGASTKRTVRCEPGPQQDVCLVHADLLLRDVSRKKVDYVLSIYGSLPYLVGYLPLHIEGWATATAARWVGFCSRGMYPKRHVQAGCPAMTPTLRSCEDMLALSDINSESCKRPELRATWIVERTSSVAIRKWEVRLWRAERIPEGRSRGSSVSWGRSEILCIARSRQARACTGRWPRVEQGTYLRVSVTARAADAQQDSAPRFGQWFLSSTVSSHLEEHMAVFGGFSVSAYPLMDLSTVLDRRALRGMLRTALGLPHSARQYRLRLSIARGGLRSTRISFSMRLGCARYVRGRPSTTGLTVASYFSGLKFADKAVVEALQRRSANLEEFSKALIREVSRCPPVHSTGPTFNASRSHGSVTAPVVSLIGMSTQLSWWTYMNQPETLRERLSFEAFVKRWIGDSMWLILETILLWLTHVVWYVLYPPGSGDSGRYATEEIDEEDAIEDPAWSGPLTGSHGGSTPAATVSPLVEQWRASGTTGKGTSLVEKLFVEALDISECDNTNVKGPPKKKKLTDNQADVKSSTEKNNADVKKSQDKKRKKKGGLQDDTRFPAASASAKDRTTRGRSSTT